MISRHLGFVADGENIIKYSSAFSNFRTVNFCPSLYTVGTVIKVHSMHSNVSDVSHKAFMMLHMSLVSKKDFIKIT